MFSLLRGYAGLFSWMVGRGVMWCVMLTWSLCSFTQAALEPAGREKWLHILQSNAAQGGFPGASGSGCCTV
jgi:hypothetical protein